MLVKPLLIMTVLNELTCSDLEYELISERKPLRFQVRVGLWATAAKKKKRSLNGLF